MAYVRTRGNQLLIVHGVRNADTGAVDQNILFTFYSKVEAFRALGAQTKADAKHFQRLMKEKYPAIKFSWPEIDAAITRSLDVLPDAYDHRTNPNLKFRKAMADFARELALADPQDRPEAAKLILENTRELKFMSSLIKQRIEGVRHAEPIKLPGQAPFTWQSLAYLDEVPPDIEEEASDLYQQGDYKQARAIFGLLVEAFDTYAEGYNYLGLIALREQRFDDAITQFEKTIALGRKLFSKRIAKASYWNDFKTRPYMRGLRNLTLTLNRSGRYDEALKFCKRLISECGDEFEGRANRAAIYLNTKKWDEALADARYLHNLFPTESFIAALASFELDQKEDAATHYLHATFNNPRSAQLLTDVKTVKHAKPQSAMAAEDHNDGIELLESISGYLTKRSTASMKFFSNLISEPKTLALIAELADATAHWRGDKAGKDRKHYDRMQEMKTPAFARSVARSRLGIISDSSPPNVVRTKTERPTVLH